MTELKKYKKKQLISLIVDYEEDIRHLQDELNNNARVKYIVIDQEKDDKTLLYIKKRMKCVLDEHKRGVYQKELERLLALQSVN